MPAAVVVNAYARFGDLDRVFAALERACEDAPTLLRFPKTHPVYDLYREDPRFENVRRRVGLQ